MSRSLLHRKNSRRSFIELLVGIVLCMAGCSRSREPTSRADLEKEFEEEFAFVPSAQVVNLRCKVVRVGDTWAKWLNFGYDEKTWRKILDQGFEAVEARDFDQPGRAEWPSDRLTKNPNAPSWWPRSPRTQMPRLYYVDRPYKKGDQPAVSSYAYLWVDESNRTVFWHRMVWQ